MHFATLTFSSLQPGPLFINIYQRIGGSSSCTLALLEMQVSKEKGIFSQSILPQQWRAAINGGSLPKNGSAVALSAGHISQKKNLLN